MVIVRNGGSDAVVGTFAGLPEGHSITFNGQTFRITYKGGDGNDVALTTVLADDVAYFNSGTWRVGLSSGAIFLTSSWATNWSNSGWLSLTSGDFNGDGNRDVLGVHSSGQLWVGVSNGTSTITAQLWGTLPTSAVSDINTVKVGDFNHDGRADVAVFSNTQGWFVALSTGTAFTVSNWSTQWAGNVGTSQWLSYQVGDFNGDGNADIATFHSSGEWWVGISNGTNHFTPVRFASGLASANYLTFQVGDFNGDGKTDVAMFRNREGTAPATWFVGLSNGTNAFAVTAWATNWGASVPGSSWLNFAAGDFNNDGFTDVAALHSSGEIWVGTSNGTSALTTTRWAAGQSVTGLRSFATGDFNADGAQDLLITYSSGAERVGLSNGGSAFTFSTFATDAAAGTATSYLGGNFGNGGLLQAADGQGAGATALADGAVSSALAQALADWARAGHGFLEAPAVKLSDLPAGVLGMALNGTILLDRDAAGHGWFVDPTPNDDAEFDAGLVALAGTAAAGRFDLLTVLRHELGHIAGLGHDADGLMTDVLATGTRKAVTDAVFGSEE
jgi:hypothetical protein